MIAKIGRLQLTKQYDAKGNIENIRNKSHKVLSTNVVQQQINSESEPCHVTTDKSIFRERRGLNWTTANYKHLAVALLMLQQVTGNLLPLTEGISSEFYASCYRPGPAAGTLRSLSDEDNLALFFPY